MKIKVALILGYDGTGYHGLQYSDNSITLESTILNILCDLGAITPQNNHPRKCGLQRACRTDKGVHAVFNVVVVKIILPIDQIQASLKDKLAEKNIYLHDIVRVPNSWVVKNRVDYRIYEYFIPKTVLKRRAVIGENIHQALNTVAQKSKEEKQKEKEKRFKNTELFEEIKYIKAEIDLEELQKNLDIFLGTKDYSNFTINKNEKGTRRHIIEVKYEELNEYFKIIIKGQSFILHQIRKMMGCLLLATIFQNDKIFNMAFSEQKINIPKAPARFLILRAPSFDFYNEKYKKTHEPIILKEDETIKEVLYGKIMQDGNLESFEDWLKTVIEYFYEFKYLLE